jgi:predicted Fe-Mo cluster-binding NifX family protein
MRLLVPTLENRGLASPLSDHFGRAPWYALLDTSSGSVVDLPNPAADHAGGSCFPIGHFLGRAPLDAVACRGIGRRPLEALHAAGIPVFVAEGDDVAGLLAAQRAGLLRAVGDERPGCGGSGCEDHGH